MHRLRIAVAALSLQLLLYYSVEHFSLGTVEGFTLSPVSYTASVLGVVLLIALPSNVFRPVWLWAAGIIAGYLAARVLLFTDPPVIGGTYTYLTLAECVLITMIVSLAHTVDRHVRYAEDLVSSAAFPGYDGVVVSGSEHPEIVHREMTRCRRYSRALSVILLVSNLPPRHGEPDATVPGLSQWIAQRYANNQLAQLVRKAVRRNDLILEWQGRDELVVVCPETNRHQVEAVVNKLKSIADESGMGIRWGFASFPDDALTFDQLLARADANLAGEDLPRDLPLDPEARSARSPEMTNGLAVGPARSLAANDRPEPWSDSPVILDETGGNSTSSPSDHS